MSKKPPQKQVDIIFDQYDKIYIRPQNKLLFWICVPLIVFSLLGLAWAIPFPYIPFLGKYNMYLNWASFLIAFVVYYYYRLAPVLSYFMLLLILIFTYFIQLLQQRQLAGGPQVWLICLVMFIISLAVQFIGRKTEGKKPSFSDDLKFLLISPIWLLHFILIRFKIKY